MLTNKPTYKHMRLKTSAVLLYAATLGNQSKSVPLLMVRIAAFINQEKDDTE